MSELATTATAEDPAAVAARTTEDVVIGAQLIRFKLATRVMHWAVAITFIATLITGLPIWTPIFGWLAPLVGGLQVCRWLHPWTGAAFFVGMLWMFVHWTSQMRLTEADAPFLKLSGLYDYLMHPKPANAGTGKFNGGQKVLFAVVVLDAVVLFATGFILWWPGWFGQLAREISIPLHDLGFILFFVTIIGHVYLGTAAFPGTFGAMVHGTVTKAWARLHHPKWYRDVTGDK